MSSQNDLAKRFRALHIPGKPVILANVYDPVTAQAVANLDSAKAIATASFSLAAVLGMEDDDLPLDDNLAAAARIAKVVKAADKPLTVDLQDGYGDRLEEAIKRAIALGAVGCNLEDCGTQTHKLFSVDEATARVATAVRVAREAGVPDFAVNARSDALFRGEDLDGVIARGKKYLEAGATSVFVWPGRERRLSRSEVESLSKAFGGRLNISLRLRGEGELKADELVELGISRISVGPQLMAAATEYYAQQAEKLLTGV